MVRVYPMYYMQPVDIARLDCSVTQDVNYNRAWNKEGWNRPAIGAAVLTRYPDSTPKYPCAPLTLYNFRQEDLDTATSHASQRDADPITGR